MNIILSSWEEMSYRLRGCHMDPFGPDSPPFTSVLCIFSRTSEIGYQFSYRPHHRHPYWFTSLGTNPGVFCLTIGKNVVSTFHSIP